MAEVTHARFRSRRPVFLGGLVGAIGIVITVVGFVVTPAQAWFAWLTAFTFAVTLLLGALLFLLIVNAAGSTWPVAIRRLVEGVLGAFPVVALCFVPILFGLDELYLWADPPNDLPPHELHLLHQKEPYLNVGFFAVRGIAYLLVWVLAAFLLRRWSFLDDRRGELPSTESRARGLSAALLPLVGLTLTFAAFDWVMSLEPTWVSTMFGVYWFAGGFVASFGLLSVLSWLAVGGRSLEHVLTSGHFHALGRLLFGFSIFWAYIAFFQAMLIQMADKPEEVVFYLHRIEGGWAVVLTLVVAGRFVIPFFLLLPRATKTARVLGPWGVVALGVHYLDTFWLVAPAAPGHGPWPTWLDLGALLAVCGLAAAFGSWRLSGRPVLPLGDPRLEKALAYRSPQ